MSSVGLVLQRAGPLFGLDGGMEGYIEVRIHWMNREWNAHWNSSVYENNKNKWRHSSLPLHHLLSFGAVHLQSWMFDAKRWSRTINNNTSLVFSYKHYNSICVLFASFIVSRFTSQRPKTAKEKEQARKISFFIVRHDPPPPLMAERNIHNSHNRRLAGKRMARSMMVDDYDVPVWLCVCECVVARNLFTFLIVFSAVKHTAYCQFVVDEVIYEW